MIIKQFRFCTLLVQEIERYHYLLEKAKKLPAQYQQDYEAQRDKYLRMLLQLPTDQKWQQLVHQLYQNSHEAHPLLAELISKYTRLYSIEPLLKIRQENVFHLLLNEDNLYSLWQLFPKSQALKNFLNQYELQPTRYRRVNLYNLVRYIVTYQRLELNDPPVNSLNLLQYNLEQAGGLQSLNSFIYLVRSQNQLQLPNATWTLILESLQPNISKQHLSQICQILQLYAHLKVKLKFDIKALVQSLVAKIEAGMEVDDDTFLEILRTINILAAHKFSLGSLKALERQCEARDLKGNREYDIFMRADTYVPVLDSKNLNRTLTDYLRKDLSAMDPKEKASLFEHLKLQIPAIQNANTLKKCLVLSCSLWPSEVSIMQKCARQVKALLETEDRENTSLAINALHQFKAVQYPFIDERLLQYLSHVELKELLPQEVSSLFYYLCSTQAKLTKKELMRLRAREEKAREEVVRILNNVTPTVMRMCNRSQLRLKVIYTLTDCYAKYKDSVSIDLPYLFEKVEYNLMKELQLKAQCGKRIEAKDLQFLHNRLRYMKVGSRKLMRFFMKARTNYRAALKVYAFREKVYRNMRKKRGKALRR